MHREGPSVYSSELADFLKVNVGFDAEYIIGKEFNAVGQSSEVELEGTYYMVSLSAVLFDRLQPYIKLGMSDLEMSWMNGSEATTAEADEDAFAWAIGLKALLWEYEDWGLKLFTTGSFRYTDPNIKSAGNKDATKSKFNIIEKQATIGISKKFEVPSYEDISIIPYAGLAYSETTAHVRFSSGTEVFNAGADGQKDNIGIFIGTDFLYRDNFSFNLEGRLLDQEAISSGCTVMF